MVAIADVPWLVKARSYFGLTEVVGPQHNKTIQLWLSKLRAWWQDDETPWCGTFVAHCMQESGFEIPKNWFRAKEWAEYGSNLRTTHLCPGAILVFDRKGGGHVGFYIAEDDKFYHVLGGNQGNKVSVMSLAKDRLVAARWPKGYPVTAKPVFVKRSGNVSRNEA